MDDRYRYKMFPEWLKSPGWLNAEVPIAVREELEDAIKNHGVDARGTLRGHLKEEYHLPIGQEISRYTADLAKHYCREFGMHAATGVQEGLEPENPDFKLDKLWVNYQKKYDFNPLHIHSGVFSFVIWVEVPYDMKEEMKRYDKCNGQETATFFFQYNGPLGSLEARHLVVDKSYEWKCAFFPARMYHGVNPFYTSDGTRVSISGNLYLIDI